MRRPIAIAAAVFAGRAALAASSDLASAQDVLAAAATNYSPQYAVRVERLLDTLFDDATRVSGGDVDSARARLDLLVARSRDDDAPLDAITDGTTLRDGRGDPATGDRLKVRFSANCDCFVYVVAIDASGRVTTIFPDADSDAANPVDADRAYVMPDHDTWWALDDRRGVEQFHALASHRKRDDIEQAMAVLTDAPVRSMHYRSVSAAITLPPTRGIVTVEDGRITSRWFRHE